MALIASVILAFSRPIFERGLPEIDEIYVDASESMNIHRDKIERIWKKLRNTYPNKKFIEFASGFKRECEKSIFTRRATDFSVLQNANGKNVLLVSDMQLTGFKSMNKMKGNLYLLPLKAPGDNVAITDVETDLPYKIPNLPVTLRIHLVNYGETTAERSLKVMGALKEVERPIKLEPNQRKTVETTVQLKGNHFKVELFPTDSIKGDDSWSGVLSEVKKQKVLIIGSREDWVYLKNALSPLGMASPFNVETRASVLPPSLLKNYQVICLLKAPNPKELAYITDYINSGGALLVFFGDESFSPLTNLLRVESKIDSSTKNLSKMDGFNGDLVKEISVKNPFYFDEGKPFLWIDSHPVGVILKEWKVALVGFKPIPENTDLVFSPLMVPIAHRIIFLLLKKYYSRNFKVGESPEVQVQEVGRYTLQTPLGNKISLLTQIRDGRPVLRLPSLEEPGIYTIKDRREMEVAVHLDPLESNPKMATKKEINSLAESVYKFPQSFLSGPKDLSKVLLLIAFLIFAIEIAVLTARRTIL